MLEEERADVVRRLRRERDDEAFLCNKAVVMEEENVEQLPPRCGVSLWSRLGFLRKGSRVRGRDWSGATVCGRSDAILSLGVNHTKKVSNFLTVCRDRFFSVRVQNQVELHENLSFVWRTANPSQ